jgi:mRNA interferase MazF
VGLTSQQIRDRYAVGITDTDFVEGTLHKPSNVRPNRLFSASTNLILYQAGRLNDKAVRSVVSRIVDILQAG